MIFLRIFKHLLPRARAWRITIDKTLRRFFEGLAEVNNEIKLFLDRVWLDIFPDTTEDIPGWERQFGLVDTGLTEQQRRDRLDAAWKALGGQSPKYIQDTLRANGFDVYVYEWWEPGTEPAVGVQACATPRNPIMYLRREYTGAVLLVECGEPLAQCGESFAQAGNSVEPRGYPLVNKVYRTVRDVIVLCGEAVAEAGEPDALAGNYFAFREELREYIVPNTPELWPYFLYIGGPSFGAIAKIDSKRRDEFEALCLKICPAQQWLGMLVEYS